MADKKISALTSATTPLAGTEVLPIVQSGTTVKATALNITGDVYIGKGAGAVSTNTVVGNLALALNATNTNITVFGYNAANATTANTTTAFGSGALALNTTGVNNTAIGFKTLAVNLTGAANVAIGREALTASTGSNNTAVGVTALSTTTGSSNVGIGVNAGQLISTGSSNVVIGSYTGSAAPISATGSNYIVLSDGSGNVRAYWNGSIAIFNGTISPVLATTAAAPAYVKGAMYFDTTLNKLRIGGATGWETVTSV